MTIEIRHQRSSTKYSTVVRFLPTVSLVMDGKKKARQEAIGTRKKEEKCMAFWKAEYVVLKV